MLENGSKFEIFQENVDIFVILLDMPRSIFSNTFNGYLLLYID